MAEALETLAPGAALTVVPAEADGPARAAQPAAEGIEASKAPALDGASMGAARRSDETRPADLPKQTEVALSPARALEAVAAAADAPAADAPTLTPTSTPTPTPTPAPTPDRSVRTDALAYEYLEKVELDESKILPELRDIYALNHDLVGWIRIEDTPIDYPVVQTEDSEFYLKHDFYGKSNANGQIILDAKCDPYTPSYNLVISGHHMNRGAMFGRLPRYRDRKYWEQHKFVEFDTLMARKRYVIFAVFYSADYDVDEKGFRYNVDVRYKLDADRWLAEIRENQRYDTGIDVAFGDEFITLTTCDRSRCRDGRFVVVARRVRAGETFE